jgi:K+-sensing histidine kinase KdpD
MKKYTQKSKPQTDHPSAKEKSQHFVASFNTTIHSAMHDLRSPLSVVKPYIDFLKRIDDAEKQEAILDRMKVAVEKMEVVINKFVKYSDLICEDSPKVERVEFREIFNEVYKEIIQQYPQVQNDVVIQDELDGMPFSYPPKYLKLVLKILLDNAFKYRSEERKLKIKINITMIHDDLLLEMKDNGMGFPACFSFEEAFVPFAKNTSPSKGTGLGLASLKYMVEKNEGEVYGSSSEDGTAFIIKLKPYPMEANRNQIKSEILKKDIGYIGRPNVTRVS